MSNRSKVANTGIEVTDLMPNQNLEEITMGINQAAIAHITARLTDLYTNPIAATIRETMSNAYDATVRVAGERKPIEVFLPSSLNPVLVIQDHGIGMSPETVKTVYTQYGSSTKTDDMSTIGAFGLGAKAPLSYCTEFTVVTVHDGIKTTFTLSRKAIGNTAKILSEKAVDEPAGTKVMIPVRNEDRSQFEQYINNYALYAVDVDVHLNGLPISKSHLIEIGEIEIFSSEKESVTSRVWVNKKVISDNYSISRILNDPYNQGEVTSSLSGWPYRLPASNRYRDSHAIIVELKPGVVDFSSSRDEIVVNDRLNMFVKKVEEGLKKLSSSILKEILKSDDPRILRAVFKEISLVEDNKLSIGNQVIDEEAAQELTFNGKKIFVGLNNETIHGWGVLRFDHLRYATYSRTGSLVNTYYITSKDLRKNGFTPMNFKHSFITLAISSPSTDEKIYVVRLNKVSEEETYSNLFARYSQSMRTLKVSNSVIFTTKDVPQEDKDFVSMFDSLSEVVYITEDELNVLLKNRRKELAKPKNLKELDYHVIDAKYFNQVKLYEKVTGKDDILSLPKDTLVVLCDRNSSANHVQGTLRGFSNARNIEKIKNEKVILIDNTQLVSDLRKVIAHFDDVIVTPTFKHSSKNFTEEISDRKYFASFSIFDSSINYGSVIKSMYPGDFEFAKRVISVLRKFDVNLDDLSEIVKSFTEDRIDFIGYSDVDTDYLNKAFGVEKVEKTMAFFKSVNRVNRLYLEYIESLLSLMIHDEAPNEIARSMIREIEKTIR